MADDFQSGICSGSWWNTTRSSSGGFDGSVAAPSASCSTSITDVSSGGGGSLSWSAAAESVSVNSQMSSGPLTDSTLQISGFGLSPPTMDWNQALLRSSGGAETSFHAMLHEPPPLNYFRHDSSIQPDQVVQVGNEDSPSNPFKDMSQTFLLDQHHHHHHQLSSGNESGANYSMTGFPASYGYPSAMLQGLLETDTKPQQSFYQSPMMGYSNNDPMAKFSQFLKGSSPPKQQSTTNHLNFSNNAPFWNPSITVPPTPQFITQSFEQKPSCSNLTTKSNQEGSVRDSCSSATKKSSSNSSNEPAQKKPRIETPSSLPTFKVRKEKLGDRITALQQLVSPFGKTDTASVLHEAIEYIKFLHEQVSVLSTPYLKNGHAMQHHQSSDKAKDGEGSKQDLRSRGLCLVPIASTYPVANETTADFWTPTFGGAYR